MEIHRLIEEIYEEMVGWRRKLHEEPELSFEEHQTAAFIYDKLAEFKLDRVDYVCETAVVALLNGGKGAGKCLAIRADIDALPLKELSNHDHVSQVEGAMHACGHDGHAAALLGAAKKLASERNFGGKVVLVFQPGEEGWSGAKHMMEDGLFERFPMQEIYAFHNSSAIEPGRIALNYGAMQAAADAFTIVVKGKGGHAS